MTTRRKMRHVKAWQRCWRPYRDPLAGLDLMRWHAPRALTRRRRIQARAGYLGDRRRLVAVRPRRSNPRKWTSDVAPGPAAYRARCRGGRR